MLALFTDAYMRHKGGDELNWMRALNDDTFIFMELNAE